MYKKVLSLTAIATTLYLSAAFPVYANPIPQYGSCLNPQWSMSQQNTGDKHGVVNVGTFAGVDTIYQSGNNVMQCLCADNGAGYQTNWLSASNLSSSQIDELKAQGWIYVLSGQSWGLQDTPYLAQNSTYQCVVCTATPTPAPTGTVTPTVTPTGVPGPTATPASQVGGASANNTGTNSLASTGNAIIIYLSLLAGAASLTIGMILKKFSK